MSYLKLSENVKFGRTCFHLHNSYRYLWFSGDYFRNISTEDYSEAELFIICQKYKANHCTILREMIKGKSIKTFLNRNRVSFKINEIRKNGGYYYNEFYIGPGKNVNLQPFFTDDTFEQLVESSYKSLQILVVKSCFLLTQKAFSNIPRIVNLLKLSVTCSRALSDNHIVDTVNSCRFLSELNISKSEQLTEKSLLHILMNCFFLESLDISGNKAMFADFTGFGFFKKPVVLKQLNLSHTNIPIENVVEIMRAAKNLREVVLEGFLIRFPDNSH